MDEAQSKLLKAAKQVDDVIAGYLEAGKLIQAGDEDIMPVVWGVINELREAISETETNF